MYNAKIQSKIFFWNRLEQFVLLLLGKKELLLLLVWKKCCNLTSKWQVERSKMSLNLPRLLSAPLFSFVTFKVKSNSDLFLYRVFF